MVGGILQRHMRCFLAFMRRDGATAQESFFFQGQILAVWIFATKLPDSDVNFAVDFSVDSFVLVSPRKRAPKQSTKKSPH